MKFLKMHGLGNDFIITQSEFKKNNLSSSIIEQLGNRNFGIGFDQLLDIEPLSENVYKIRIFNSDGSEAFQCGNGLRCVAKYLLTDQPAITLIVGSNHYHAISHHHEVEVSMGSPFDLITGNENITLHSLTVGQETIDAYLVTLGNPHCIVMTNNIIGDEFDTYAQTISSHPQFADGINVSFVEKIADDAYQIRTFERGAGETLACGSAACAAAACIAASTPHQLTLHFKGGALNVRIDEQGRVYQNGPAKHVFEGSIDLAELSEH